MSIQKIGVKVKKILIIGACSAIASATARIWAKNGAHFFLVGRNEDALKTLATDLTIRGATKIDFGILDANNFHEHELTIEKAFIFLGKIDIVLIAHGTLPNQKQCETSVQTTLHEINTNALSVVSLLTYLANRFEKQAHGVIAVISSVAGDRGRASNYVYGSAKSLVTTFTSGLRQRLHKFGVTVLTVKPGLTDTPMTQDFEKNIFWAKSDNVAIKVVKAIERKQSELYVPLFWQIIMLGIKLIPMNIYIKMKL